MRRANDAPGRLRRKKPGLVRHLVVVLLLKTILLVVLWHVFIKPNRVAVDDAAMAAHLAGALPQALLEKK